MKKSHLPVRFPVVSLAIFPAVFATFLGSLPTSAAADMPQLELNIGLHRIEAEVAANQPHRMQGLMQRRSMAPHQGMLFVFPVAARHCMWMKNTYLPLSVAFIDDDGAIVNIEDMQPETEDSHCAARPARYALEMNRGWFAARKIRAGARLGGLAKVPAGR